MYLVRLLFLVNILEAKDFFDFGVVNYRPQWIFHCLFNQIKRVEAPNNDQPLISYECPLSTKPIEILPLEIDLTYLCRIDSRLFWFIIDLYQFNDFSWRIDAEQIDIRIKFNDQILLTDYRRETTNLTSRSIFINAFYIPFESFSSISNDSIDIQIVLLNLNRSNRCEFYSKDHRTWKTILTEQCQTSQSHSLIIHHGECHFYLNESIEHSQTNLPDLNVILSIDQENTSMMITDIPPLPPSHRHFYSFFEQNSHLIFSSLNRTKIISNLLKISVGLLIAILIIMILFFVYILFYQHFLRRHSSSMIDRISLDI